MTNKEKMATLTTPQMALLFNSLGKRAFSFHCEVCIKNPNDGCHLDCKNGVSKWFDSEYEEWDQDCIINKALKEESN